MSPLTKSTLLLTLPLLSSCNFDMGLNESEVITPSPYPDINSVPFGKDATQSRGWHGPCDEAMAREMDEKSLEKQRLLLEKRGKALRTEANTLLKSRE